MHSPRRTISEALNLAQSAFLRQPENGGGPSNGTAPDSIPISENEVEHAPITRRRSRPTHFTRAAMRNATNAGRPEPLRSVTLRLPWSLADALRRTSIHRSLNYVEPYSQQAIAEAALREWLVRENIEV